MDTLCGDSGNSEGEDDMEQAEHFNGEETRLAPAESRGLLRRVSVWTRSLQAQLLLWAILPVTLVIIGLSFTGIYTHQHAMRGFVSRRDQVLAHVLAVSLGDALRVGDVAPDGEGATRWLPIGSEDATVSVLIVDDDGRVLAQTDTSSVESIAETPWGQEALSMPEGSIVIDNTADGLGIVTFAVVTGTSWRVVVRSSVATLLGPVLRFSSLGPIAAAAAGSLSLLILTFGWRTIARPLQQLSGAASAVSWPSYTLIQERISGVSEIEELHRAINEMVERLESYQAGVLDYLDAMSKGQEQERTRLAHELHDGPVQSVIALIQRTERAGMKMAQGNLSDARALLEELRETEVAVVEDLRRIVGALRPAYLEDLGFIPALQMLVHSADARNGTQVALVVQNERRLSAEIELAAYRIAQEALNNAVKHATANHVTVTVNYSSDGVLLQIVDDGKGFVPSERLDTYTQEGHFGLVGLHERARQLGGSFQIESSPGQGAAIRVKLPERAVPQVTHTAASWA
jgi:signal transduction histidine kinase